MSAKSTSKNALPSLSSSSVNMKSMYRKKRSTPVRKGCGFSALPFAVLLVTAIVLLIGESKVRVGIGRVPT